MSPRTERLLYFVLAAGALVGTWTFNLRHMASGGTLTDFIQLSYANDAVAAVTADIGLTVVILFPWMIREAIRYQIRHLWAYLFFGLTIAISVTFPLFLAARRTAVEAVGERSGPSALTAFYPVLSAIALVVCNFFTLRYLLQTPSLTAFAADWFSNLPGASLSVDLIFLGASLVVFLLAEAHRGNVRHVAAYIAMSIFSVAFALPWFLRSLDVRTIKERRPRHPA